MPNDDIAALQEQLTASWKKQAIAAYPNAISAEVQGVDEQSFLESAKQSQEAFNEKVDAASKQRIAEAEARFKKQAWSGGTGAPGSSGSTGQKSWEDRVNRVWMRIRDQELKRGDEADLIDARLGDILRNSDTVAPRLKEWAQAGFGKNKRGPRGD